MGVGCNPAVKTVVKRNFVISKLGRLRYRVTIKVIIYGSLITPMIRRSFTACMGTKNNNNNNNRPTIKETVERADVFLACNPIKFSLLAASIFRSKCRPGHFRKSLFHTSRWPMAKWVCVCQTTEICSKKCMEFYIKLLVYS